ncbi:putative hemolysin [Litoreibacter ponti]|uniref:Putative hemolysin n=1 Tax=Litoreibacter ponti TaxID=1510457 RepID=A0A2T6BFW3_9RHOB|nr:lysophospholipid acyltransferase family protein [Litoreibacter ponti]PTX54955.1 putative hemolysin [Litoreibacter ponti]
MHHVIDPLIEDRAPWLFQGTPAAKAARWLAERALRYRKTLGVAEMVADMPTAEIMSTMGNTLARKLDVAGLANIPSEGPALIVANHPTGIADGIILHHLIAARRPDLFIYANSDILRVLPQMEDLILPVEWRLDRRTHSKTKETLRLTAAAVEQGRPGLIFPSGRLAKRRLLKLHERPWMTSAAMMARKFGLPVIPINIQARNSALFYLLDMIHPTLRDITLFHETLNKHRQPYRIRVGRPILPQSLPKSAKDGTDLLRDACLSLGAQSKPAVSLVRTTGWLPKLT